MLLLWGFRILTEKLSACNKSRLFSIRCHKNGKHLCLSFCNSLENLDIYNHTVRMYGTQLIIAAHNCHTVPHFCGDSEFLLKNLVRAIILDFARLAATKTGTIFAYAFVTLWTIWTFTTIL